MSLSTTFRLLTIGAVMSVALLTSGTLGARNVPSTAGRIRIVLENLASADCPTQCEEITCTNGHKNLSHNLGTNAGEVHTCALSLNGCQDHTCGAEDFDNLESLLAQVSASELAVIDANWVNLYINRARRAVQVLGCGNRVVLSVPLTPDQESGLAQAVGILTATDD